MKRLSEKPLLRHTRFVASDFEQQNVETPYGVVPVEKLILADDRGAEHGLVFIHRHHGKGTTPPHMIDYRANINAAASFQPTVLVTVHAVGSLSSKFPPGSLGLAADVLDLTGMVSTFHDENATHAPLSNHFGSALRDLVRPILVEGQQTSDVEADLLLDHIVAQMSGPQFETAAEIEALHRLGATTVGMTLSPEARLVAELELPQLGLLVSSNWATGRDPAGPDAEIDHHSVENEASRLQHLVWKCITTLLDADVSESD